MTRGTALPHRAIHGRPGPLRRPSRRSCSAAPASNSAASTPSRADCRQARGLNLFDELAPRAALRRSLAPQDPRLHGHRAPDPRLCLGANLTIFAVIDAVLLRPLPFPDAGRLVTMYNTYPKAGVDRDGSSVTNYYERRGRIPAFSSLSIYRYGTASIGEPGSTERVPVPRVSPDFFTTLGAGPAIGTRLHRCRNHESDRRRRDLTDAYWRTTSTPTRT